MKVRYWIYFIAGLLVFWLILSSLINNIYILPSPFMVIEIMIKLLFVTSFYSSVFMSVFRAVLSVYCFVYSRSTCCDHSLRNHSYLVYWKNNIDLTFDSECDLCDLIVVLGF